MCLAKNSKDNKKYFFNCISRKGRPRKTVVLINRSEIFQQMLLRRPIFLMPFEREKSSSKQSSISKRVAKLIQITKGWDISQLGKDCCTLHLTLWLLKCFQISSVSLCDTIFKSCWNEPQISSGFPLVASGGCIKLKDRFTHL